MGRCRITSTNGDIAGSATLEVQRENRLFIRPSEHNREMPELFTFDGFSLVVAVISGVSDVAQESIKTLADNYMHRAGLAKLERGYMVDNRGRVHSGTTTRGTQRIVSERTVFTNEGIRMDIVQGRNFTVPGGTSTRGISQIDYFATRGTARVRLVGLFRKAGPILAVVLDMVDIMKFANYGMATEVLPIPIVGQVSAMAISHFREWDVIMDEITESKRQELLREAKLEGIESVSRLINSRGNRLFQLEVQRGDWQQMYRLLSVTPEIASQILDGKFRSIFDIEDARSNTRGRDRTVEILYRTIVHPTKGEIVIIETFFIGE